VGVRACVRREKVGTTKARGGRIPRPTSGASGHLKADPNVRVQCASEGTPSRRGVGELEVLLPLFASELYGWTRSRGRSLCAQPSRCSGPLPVHLLYLVGAHEAGPGKRNRAPPLVGAVRAFPAPVRGGRAEGAPDTPAGWRLRVFPAHPPLCAPPPICADATRRFVGRWVLSLRVSDSFLTCICRHLLTEPPERCSLAFSANPGTPAGTGPWYSTRRCGFAPFSWNAGGVHRSERPRFPWPWEPESSP